MRFKTKAFLLYASLTSFLWISPLSEADKPKLEEVVLPKPVSELSLDEVKEIALQHSPLIKEAQLNIAVAELDVKATSFWKSLLPALNITTRYDPLLGDSRFGVGISWDVKDMLNNRNQSKHAKIKLFDAQLYEKNTRNRIVEIVTKSFSDYRIAQLRVAVSEDKLANGLKTLELAKVKFETGKIEQDELLKLEDLINEDMLKLSEANAELLQKELKLRHDIGVNE